MRHPQQRIRRPKIRRQQVRIRRQVQKYRIQRRPQTGHPGRKYRHRAQTALQLPVQRSVQRRITPIRALERKHSHFGVESLDRLRRSNWINHSLEYFLRSPLCNSSWRSHGSGTEACRFWRMGMYFRIKKQMDIHFQRFALLQVRIMFWEAFSVR